MNNKLDSYVFPATFFKGEKPNEQTYSICFPDLPGAISYGDSLEHALEMAKECLEFHLLGMEEDNETIPQPTPLENIKEGMVIPIVANMKVMRLKHNVKVVLVKKTLNIPAWLDAEAKQNNINFSKLLQDSLLDVLGYNKN